VDVPFEPRHLGGACAESSLGTPERREREVEHCHLSDALLEQRIDERRVATADVDDRALRAEAGGRE